MAYSDKVIDHYENPRNVGSLDKNADDVGTGLVAATTSKASRQRPLKNHNSGRYANQVTAASSLAQKMPPMHRPAAKNKPRERRCKPR